MGATQYPITDTAYRIDEIVSLLGALWLVTGKNSVIHESMAGGCRKLKEFVVQYG